MMVLNDRVSALNYVKTCPRVFMYMFNIVNLSFSTIVYTYKTTVLKDVYTAYCKAKLYVVNDK